MTLRLDCAFRVQKRTVQECIADTTSRTSRDPASGPLTGERTGIATSAGSSWANDVRSHNPFISNSLGHASIDGSRQIFLS